MTTTTTAVVVNMKLLLKYTGRNDKDVFGERNGLRDRLANGPGKMAVADGGYDKEQDMAFLCIPNSLNSRELREFQSRACCHHESLNGQLCNFKILQDKFRHGLKCHQIAWEAVAVIVQYQMDHGAPSLKFRCRQSKVKRGGNQTCSALAS